MTGAERSIGRGPAVAIAAAVAIGLAVLVVAVTKADDGPSDGEAEAIQESPERAPTVVATQPTQAPTATPDVEPTPATPTPAVPTAATSNHPISRGTACTLRLHGNNGSGGIDPDATVNGPYYAAGRITLLDPISPTITDQNTWWEFDGPYGTYSDTDEHYDALVAFLRDHVDSFDCGPILVWGLSGGGAMAVELYCNGEDFEGRVWGYYFADPPMGESVLDCTPPPDSAIRTWLVQSDEFVTAATTYVTEGDGTCPVGEWGWYCEDGRAMAPEDWRAELGLEPLALVPTHIEALLSGTPVEFNMWDQVENWWREYDPARFS